MTERAHQALAATRRLRDGLAARGGGSPEQRAMLGDLEHIERVLRGQPRLGDPYALAQATPADLQRDLAGPTTAPSSGGRASAPAAPAAPAGGRPSTFQQFAQVGAAVDAVGFPGFVAGLVTGTFQAIVDATVQQLREYAQLVASLSRTADEFAADNVTDDQVRAALAGKHRELRHVAAPAGSRAPSRLEVAPDAVGSTPRWLADYDLGDEPLSPELAAGPLVAAGRRRVAEERMQSLASMVLMGINRIVVNDGVIRAKVQFTANARDATDAEMTAAQAGQGIAGRGQAMMPQLAVSTAKANTQSESAMKANLTGEVKISFRTETFPLERFADSAAIQLLNRHARWRTDEPAAPAAPAPGEDRT